GSTRHVGPIRTSRVRRQLGRRVRAMRPVRSVAEQPSDPSRRASAGDLPELAAVLAKAKAENFSVGPGFLPPTVRADLMAIYGYARFVDDIGDETSTDAPGRLALLDLVDGDVTVLFAGREPSLPPVRALVAPVRAGRMPEEPLRRLVEANRLDQQVSSYDTIDDLRHYCTLSADPVGRLVLAVISAATPERIAWSDQVCTGLQLVEHWQDVAEDHARGRVYLPQVDMKRFGVTDADLGAPHATPALKSLLAFESARAREFLDAGVPLVKSISGRPKLAIAGFVAGGRAALHAIAAVDFDVLPGAPKSNSRRRVRETIGVLAGRLAPTETVTGR
ncbi:MAG: squalene synthase HpnC, partial [Acidothermaceae bacterium]